MSASNVFHVVPGGKPEASKIERPATETFDSRPRRILVAEDNRLTQGLLKLLLNQRGHHVDVAVDGEQALSALRQNTYDVAFLDYNLPKLAGPKVAATIRREANGRKIPRMIAITADLKALLQQSEGSDRLDKLLPLDLDVEPVAEPDDEDSAETAEAEVVQLRPTPAAQFVTEEHRSAFENLGYNFLSWPGDIETGRLSARAMRASMGDPRFDGILIREPASIEMLATLWTEPALYALPLIDLTGQLGVLADFDGSKLADVEKGELDQVIGAFRERRARLHRDVLMSTDRSEQLIGRAFVSGRQIVPHYDPNSKWLAAYDVALPIAVLAREAETLYQRGLLQREFFDRFHVCPRCDSRRLHVREECSECHSSDIVEGQYIHHFSCAYLGPEEDFRKGDDLACPKCSKELTHFGFDYDRPGSMVSCRSCGHASSDPGVGFVCLDCSSHVDGEAAETRDLYTYRLTDQGLSFAEHGRSAVGTADQATRFADLPLELVVAINKALKSYEEEGASFTLTEFSYVKEKEVTFEEGPRAFTSARELFVENLRGALGRSGVVVRGQSRDYMVCSDSTLADTKTMLDPLISQAQATLRCSIGATAQTFGPEAFA